MKRRDSRELALKLLYSVELSDLDQIDATQRYASFQKGLDPEVYEYAVKLLNWTLASYKEIQEQLKSIVKFVPAVPTNPLNNGDMILYETQIDNQPVLMSRWKNNSVYI